MASLTIRNLEDDTKERLRVRAAQNGRSMAEEAHASLRGSVAAASASDLWDRSRALFAGAEGVDFGAPTRDRDRAPPSFGEDE